LDWEKYAIRTANTPQGKKAKSENIYFDIDGPISKNTTVMIRGNILKKMAADPIRVRLSNSDVVSWYSLVVADRMPGL